jgi:hypothetical protein
MGWPLHNIADPPIGHIRAMMLVSGCFFYILSMKNAALGPTLTRLTWGR